MGKNDEELTPLARGSSSFVYVDELAISNRKISKEKRFGRKSNKNIIGSVKQKPKKPAVEPISLGGSVFPFADSAKYL